jgi:glycosyltransferase involved in cell wall biosynthesis
MLGDGEERENLIQLSFDLGISDRVHFIPYFTDVMEYLRIGTLYWSTSISEGFSIANLEAMSMAIPTIVTDVDGNREMLQSWPDYRVDLDDYKKLADISEYLLLNSDERSKIGHEMRDYVLKNYTSNAMVTNYINLYKTIIENI